MNNTSQIKSFFEYLPACIKFHKLKNEGMARLIFVLVLFCQLVSSYVQYRILNSLSSDDLEALFSKLLMGSVASSKDIVELPQNVIYLMLILLGTVLLAKLVSNLFLSVYMYSYLSELRGKPTGYIACFKGTFKHMGRLIFYNIIFGILVLIGSMILIIPGIIAYAIFAFGYCYILDLKLNIADAMTACNEITKGKKTQVISVFIGFFLLLKMPIILLLSGGDLGTAFIACFFTSITSLILQRLITRVYMDLEYKKESKTIR